MYSQQQASEIRQAFWTTFGQYMRPIMSAEGEKVNWINYKTNVKYITIKMEADNKSAMIGIFLTHPDPDTQALDFEQLQELRNTLHAHTREDWTLLHHTRGKNGKVTSGIYKEIEGVSVLKRED